jgi:hypothetical protein
MFTETETHAAVVAAIEAGGTASRDGYDIDGIVSAVRLEVESGNPNDLNYDYFWSLVEGYEYDSAA